jgi:hypothetical protein
MVKDGAQLYTMEGIAAGLIMLLTAYLVLGTTSVYTPGDTHITDMQLEQVGSDILKVMDTPLKLNDTRWNYQSNRSDLELIVNGTNGDPDPNGQFIRKFMTDYLCNDKAVARETAVGCSGIQINAVVWYLGNSVGSYNLPDTTQNLNILNLSRSEPGVRVTHWIHTNGPPHGNIPAVNKNGMSPEPQELLLEVVMWKA